MKQGLENRLHSVSKDGSFLELHLAWQRPLRNIPWSVIEKQSEEP